ncbi:MAG: efflux RND transporter periplasmic adaptor subunit [Oscillospiraceae bacterium]|nr:efflux RND transporter periplasmic adaptor subunit [Oscillospiraceae bacterium]
MSKANTKGKKGSKIKFIIIGIILLLVIGFVATMISSASMMSGMTMVDIYQLEKKNIENTVSVSGIIESQTFEQVSSKLAYNIETVNVEVGDKVKAGDILATLNSDDLQDQIVQQQAAVDSSNVNTEYSLSDAEKRYNEALEQIEAGTYPEIRNAKMSLDSAEKALEKAQEKYDEQLEIAGTDDDSQLVSAQKGVESAKYELECAEDDYAEAKEDYDNEDYSDIKDLKKAYDDAKKEYNSRYSETKNKELTDARNAYEDALAQYTYLSSMISYGTAGISQSDVSDAQQKLTEAQQKLAELEAKYNVETTEDTYEKTLEAYTKAKADIDSANSTKLTNAERALERAKTAYENALNSLNSVENGSDTSMESYSDAVNDARKAAEDARESYDLAVKNAESTLASLKAAADREKVLSENDSQLISLQILKDKLDDCVIKAPCDGTVTAVNAVEGSAAAGVLFIIEDTDKLKMTATVKEYSIGNLKEDLEVTVTVPSINNKEFTGVISKIAPTGTKGADGRSDGTASFKIEVLIHDTKDSGVLIGMNGKCVAVTGSAENVFAVGYDALVEEADGTCCIYAADMVEGGGGTATARKIIVDTGFESDAEVEIISSELTEGMDIISNAGDVTDGGLVISMSALGDAVQSAAAAE